MKHNKLLINLLGLIVIVNLSFLTITASAQKQIKKETFNKAVDLYQTSNYIGAGKMFSDLLAETPENDPVRFDLDYYRLMCLVKQNNRSAENEITLYLANESGTPWENQLWYELGKMQFQTRKYKIAAKTFEKVDAQHLNQSDINDYKFFIGYSNFEAGDMKKASQAFFEVKKGNSIYAETASYYWGYINYLDGKYETALQEFKKLEHNKQFSGFIPYYTTQIYYLQEKWDLVIEKGEGMVNAAPTEQRNELLKMVGDAYFETGKYIKATQYLDAYKGIDGKKTREDYYRVAYCYYQVGENQKAIESFEKAAPGNDQLAQNALYHLGDCYLKVKDKKKARSAFEQASKFSFNADIEEDALFNYAKLSYELSYSPFNETIKAFDQYITKYPNSERNDAAFDYLVKVYMTTKNYRDAISSIEKIKVQSPSVKEAYQRVTYYRGLELFNDGNYKGSIQYLEKSLVNSTYNRTYKAQALYWKAEAEYRMGNYAKAIDGFALFQSTPGAFSLPEFGTAYYNTGYCYFNQKKYDQSSVWFRKYLSQSKATDQMKADANNRVGDCLFISRDYTEAAKYYTNSYSLKSFDPDYALFQRAECKGLNKEYAQKVADLDALVNQFPSSSYIANALFELARTYERINNLDKAIEYYNKLLAQIPESSYTKKTLLQLGLIYYNKNDYNKSLEYYKKVVEKYPNTEESNAAFVGIKNNYVDMNNADGYFDYSKSTGSAPKVTSSEQDSIFYLASEKKYMANEEGSEAQMEEYLTRFPNGSFTTNANFYLAQYYYSKAQYSKSLGYYEEVTSKPDNIFSEQSLLKAGELTFNAGKYDVSSEYFKRLEKLSTSKWNTLKSRAGVMRCNYKLGQYAEAIKAASKLLTSENVTEIMVREANFILASSNYKLLNIDEAYKYFTILAEDTKTAEGAESKHIKAQILYDRGNIKDCENEIMDFISKNSPHQFWLAKSFILLSDVYFAQNDLFQARHTLKSILDNYTNQTDGIIGTVNEKMKVIEAKERESIIPELPLNPESPVNVSEDTIPNSEIPVEPVQEMSVPADSTQNN